MERSGSDPAGTASRAVTVVTAPGCHLCGDALRALAELGRDHPVTVEEIPSGSPAGQALLREHGAGLFPLVLVDGAYFSAGRMPRRKLARMLGQPRTASRAPLGGVTSGLAAAGGR